MALGYIKIEDSGQVRVAPNGSFHSRPGGRLALSEGLCSQFFFRPKSRIERTVCHASRIAEFCDTYPSDALLSKQPARGSYQETGADELIVVSDVYDHPTRLRSFELIAKAAGIASV
jgi:hypothetical protein